MLAGIVLAVLNSHRAFPLTALEKRTQKDHRVGVFPNFEGLLGWVSDTPFRLCQESDAAESSMTYCISSYLLAQDGEGIIHI